MCKNLLFILLIIYSFVINGSDRPEISLLTGMPLIEVLNKPHQALSFCVSSGTKKTHCKKLLKEEFEKMRSGSYKFCRETGRSKKECKIYRKNFKPYELSNQQRRKCFEIIKSMINNKEYESNTPMSNDEVELFLKADCFEV